MHPRVDFTAIRAAGQRYFGRWQELREQGVKIVVLSRAEHPRQWQAWQSYYRAHGLWALLDLMDEGRSEKSVPCLDPADFEPLVFVEVGPDRRVKDD